MRNRFSLITVMYFLILIIFLSGCGEENFYSYYEDFKENYLDITDMLDSKEPFASIDNLNKEIYADKMNNLSSIVSKMKEKASTKTEKGILSNVSKYYEGLKFLQYASKNKDTLSQDERGRIATELTLIELHKTDLKEGE